MYYLFLLILKGTAFIWGTYMMVMFELYMKKRGSKKTLIDGLTLFEQRVNFLCAPVVFMQLIWIANWIPPRENHVVTGLALALHVAFCLAGAHRGVGSLLIGMLR